MSPGKDRYIKKGIWSLLSSGESCVKLITPKTKFSRYASIHSQARFLLRYTQPFSLMQAVRSEGESRFSSKILSHVVRTGGFKNKRKFSFFVFFLVQSLNPYTCEIHQIIDSYLVVSERSTLIKRHFLSFLPYLKYYNTMSHTFDCSPSLFTCHHCH